MNQTFKKLAQEINWIPTEGFFECEAKHVIRNKTSQLKICLSNATLLPFVEFSDFHSKLITQLPQVKILEILVENPKCTVDNLRDYLVFILDEKLNSTHLPLLVSGSKIKQIDSVSFEFSFVSQSVVDKFLTILPNCLENLLLLGFPKLNLIAKVLENEKNIVSIEMENARKLDAEASKTFVENRTAPTKGTITSNYNGYESLKINEARKTHFKKVVLVGKITDTSETEIPKKELTLLQVSILDETDAMFCKIFLKKDGSSKFENESLRLGNIVELRGELSDDSYTREKVLMIKNLKVIEYSNFAQRKDQESVKRIELCARTKMSAFDGVIDPKSLIDRARFWGHKAIGVVDSDNVQSFPELYNYAKQFKDIKVLYGATINVISHDVQTVINSSRISLDSTTFVVFDLETTGLFAQFDQIIEFGAVKLKEGVIIDRIQFFVNINRAIPIFITKLTGITNKDIESGISPIDAMNKICDFFADNVLVAHNSSFDMSFIKKSFAEHKIAEPKNPVIDTLQLAKLLLEQKSYALNRVCKSYGIDYDIEVAHRADYDTEVLSKVFLKMLADLAKNRVKTLEELHNFKTKNIYAKIYPKTMTLFAKNQQGLKDLFRIISNSLTTNYQNQPITFENELFKNRTNLLIGSSEGESQVLEAALTASDKKLEKVMKKFDFVEIQPPSCFAHLVNRNILTIENLQLAIAKIIKIGKKIGIRVVATAHSRYLDPEQKMLHKVYIHTKGLGGVRHKLYRHNEKDSIYPDYHMRTTKEMKQEFAFLNDKRLIDEIVVTNPSSVIDEISDITVLKSGLYTPTLENVEEKLTEVIETNARLKYGKTLPKIIDERIKKEWRSITTYKFGVVYWLAYRLVSKSLADGYLVGSRGSVGSSLIATLLNITEVNPLEPHYYCSKCEVVEFPKIANIHCGYDLPNKHCAKCNQLFLTDGHSIPFETFLGFEGDKIPDIDLNFSGEYQNIIHLEVKNLFDAQHAFRAGTISTVATKTAFGYVKNYQEEMDLDFSKAYVDYLVKGIEGTKRTTGQHPGGIIVIPKEYDVEDFTPVNYPANDVSSSWQTTHFDFHAIHDNVLKLDLLGHDDPTAIKMLEDLTNVRVSSIPNFDEKVISIFNSPENLGVKSSQIMGEKTGALGIPEFGTDFVRRMLNQVKIKSFADLVSISGLSHGTDVWTNNAQDLIKKMNLNLSQIISCRDDIMVYLINLGIEEKESFFIMERVRKGKGLSEDQIKIMEDHGVPSWYIESCKMIKYIFPKAHATAYVKMAWRIAWYKINYPLEYYATFFSTRSDALDIFTMIKGQKHVEEKLEELNARRFSKGDSQLSPKESALINPLQLAQEMFARGYKIQNIDIEKSDSKNWGINHETKSLIPPFIAIDGLGSSIADSIIEARLKGPFLSIEDLQARTNVNQTQVKIMKDNKILEDFSERNQISFDIFNF